MRTIPFWKMAGAGNDFVVIDNRGRALAEKELAPFARATGDRRRGVGSDGLLAIEAGRVRGADFRMRFFNPDGSEAEMCGNGSRCIALFAREIGAAPESMRFETLAGPVSAEIAGGSTVRVTLPDVAPAERFTLDDLPCGKPREIVFLNTGVPHAVVALADEAALEAVPVKDAGRAIRRHARFEPAGANANFLVRLAPSRVRVRTYERGVEDETLACGTGAVASAIAASILWDAAPPVEVETRGGETLTIRFERDGPGSPGGGAGARNVALEGPVEVSFRGEYDWTA